MYSIHRYLYGTIIGSLIVWTIYLLTIDFFSIAFVPYQYKQLIHVPLPGSWLNFSFLAVINLVTIFVISCLTLVAQFKNIKIIPTPIYRLDGSEDKAEA
ncbi:unnamed protein product [Commensalibacter communis]|uniref:Uncharacterized protein n=1 Tax=Commensalibacter communis TaxID=2972786 RepID=A0A9W4X798_9PROT|nr:hypothetical protein [Commensalibacter communis]CAI3949519.1 unnamed protein product [Commensalibacter communis]CAI3950377.1 unnamed protein product [Commensalibacter communis]CAI3951997.1 unnamed protein product [Commensalibacter communis]CAI3952005.1 unnamed protein product [Commensalibacter communis]CAI3952632.1 unnamed protein product [Commensalibacter communis]